MARPSPYSWLVLAATFLVGGAAGALLYAIIHQHSGRLADVHEFNNKYHFINPLLACGEDLSTLSNDEARKLQEEVEKNIEKHKASGDVTEVALYYRDLRNGPWVGVNFNTPYTPGSLLKVPLAMSIYKNAESDPALLAKQLEYTGQEVNDEQFFKPTPFPPGKHSVEELVRQMLLNSDNNAANLLANEVGVDDFEATYDHLGISKPPSDGDGYTTSTREYASFFRILYNATYLDSEYSEELLKLLSESTFKDGLAAGLPASVVVAHKFGERAVENSSLKQLHDCGIVYVPNHPYLLCIMTRGYELPAMAKTIADLSWLTYNYAK